ncbi:MAG: squalene synthase HpnC [Melioribacter sp.]|nr:squalene synthase HpnC [Melioribacter sp.]
MKKVYNLGKAYKNAVKFTSSHYENFPVASILLPLKIRKHVAIIYQFARQADDMADEGNYPVDFRLMLLENYKKNFIAALNGNFENDFWHALKNTIDNKRLSVNNFFNLLSAFEQDVVKNRYKTFEEVISYCQRSANPIGRLILELFNIRDNEIISYSDSICTALQLTNFYQDILQDYEKGRIYIPLDEMIQYEVNENIFELKKNNVNFKRLMKLQIERTREFYNRGEKILKYLSGRLKLQIKLTILGGREILKKIEEIEYDTLNKRPILTKHDLIKLLYKSLSTL